MPSPHSAITCKNEWGSNVISTSLIDFSPVSMINLSIRPDRPAIRIFFDLLSLGFFQ